MEEASLIKICRACLTEEGEMQSVFVPDEKTGSHIHLAEMIMAYASVQVTVYDIFTYKHFATSFISVICLYKHCFRVI